MAQEEIRSAGRVATESARPSILFVLGAARSGSTVLEREMARTFSNSVGVGEQRFVWSRGFGEDQLCSCGSPFLECPFWSQVRSTAYPDTGLPSERFLQGLSGVDRTRYMVMLLEPRLRSPSFRRKFDTVQEDLGNWYQSIAQVSAGSVIIDTSKDPSYAYLLASLSGIDLSFVHLVRHPAAVAHSWSREKLRPEIHWKSAQMEVQSPLRSGLEWDFRMATARILRRRFPANWLDVTYEEFARRPATILAEIRELMDRQSVAIGTGNGAFHSVAGNPIRFEAEPRPIKIDEEWRSTMPRSRRMAATAVALPMWPAYRGIVRTRGGR